MNFSSLIDWAFFWKVFQNIVYSVMPFGLIVVGIIAAGMVLKVVIAAVKQAMSKG